MTVVAFITDAIPSHLYSSMGLARRLEARGYTCEYWGDARIRDMVVEQGFGFRPLQGIWSRYQAEIRIPTSLAGIGLLAYLGVVLKMFGARRRLRPHLLAALQEFERSLDQTLLREQPAFVVFDAFLLAYYPFFRQKGIPGVVLSSKPVPVADPAVPPYSSYLVPTARWTTRLAIRAAWVRLRILDRTIRLMEWIAGRLGAYTHSDLVTEAARATGFDLAKERVRRWIHPDLHFRSVPEWALWLPQTDLPRVRELPRNVRFVGPSVDLARRETNTPVKRGTKQFLIYVAVGTVRFRWKDNLPFLRKVVDAFGNDVNIDVVISTGDDRATAALGPTPPNIRVFDFLPQLQMLDLADLVITHAGAGTFREAIAKEVPMLAYPRNHDQMGNSARVAFHRLGLRGRRERDTAEEIRGKALTILHDSTFRDNLRRARLAAEAYQGQMLNDELEMLGVPAFARAPEVYPRPVPKRLAAR